LEATKFGFDHSQMRVVAILAVSMIAENADLKTRS
jgi:hypothetical protein